MPYLTIDDEKIFYSVNRSDEDRFFLAIHGSGGNSHHWPEPVRALPGVTVYAIDLPGHGNSTGKGRNTVDAYADFIEIFVQHLGLNKLTLMGHSLGGAIVQMLALRSPNWLSGIILVGTGARLRVHPDLLDRVLSNFSAAIDLICSWAFDPNTPASLIDAARAELRDVPPETVYGDFIACDRFDMIERVAEIRLPTLVISGTGDHLTPLKYGEYLAAQIPGAKHAIIEGGGHMMALEKPKEFIHHITTYLSIHSAGN